MWIKPVKDLNWQDISTICPICDKQMEYIPCYYGHAKCEHGHYEVSAGNYHVDFYIDGELVATTDDMFNEKAYAILEKVIPEARKKWRENF